VSLLAARIGGADWQLFAAPAALHVASRTLVVADAHFGKAAAFRARGVPVPQGTTTANLARLTTAIEAIRPRTLVFLGDLFHARESHAPATLAALAQWRAVHDGLEMVLVEGNHDRRAGPPPAALRLRVECEPWFACGVAFCHHPQRIDAAAVVAGHLHPCMRLRGRGDDGLRLPCFWLREGLAILPAFGEFTGGAPIVREPGDRVVAVAEGRLFDVPGYCSRQSKSKTAY